MKRQMNTKHKVKDDIITVLLPVQHHVYHRQPTNGRIIWENACCSHFSRNPVGLLILVDFIDD